MLFFFKEKPIEIIAMVPPSYSLACEQTPIKPARECFPTWWKDTPSSKFDWEAFSSVTTVKSCPGIGLSLQRGFIMHQWSDLAIQTQGEEWRWRYSDNISSAGVHNNIQSPGFYSDHHIFKLTVPWIVISPVDLFLQFPVYLFGSPPPYVTPSGFVPTYKNTCALNTFLLFKKSDDIQQHIIKYKTPLLQIIPFTEKKVTVKCEVVSDNEYTKIRSKISTVNHFASRGLKNIHEEK